MAAGKRRNRRKQLRKRKWKRRKRLPAVVTAVCFALLICLAAKTGSLRERLIPAELISFGERNPEAASYVNDYLWKHLIPYAINLRGEVRQGEVPLFLQWDERWGYKTYGSGFMGLTGCGPTCLSMVICGKTGRTDVNPWETARYAEENGFYIQGAGTAWSLMTVGAQHYGLEVEEGEVSASYIFSRLSSSAPMICSVGPGDFTREGHFIVLTGVDESGNILLHDPNSPARSAQAWSVERLVSQISGIWWYP